MMGFYERGIVPRLLDLAMRNRLLDDYRQRTIETARGLVLEVGVGSGVTCRSMARQSPASLVSIHHPNRSDWRGDERVMRFFLCRCSELLRNTFKARCRGHSCIRDRRKKFERSLAGNKSL